MTQPRITQQRWEQDMHARMVTEGKRNDLIQRASETRRAACDIEGRVRAEGLQRKNEAARYAAQTFFEDRMLESDSDRRVRERDVEQAELLSKAIGDSNREQDRWEMEITRICEKDPSLRELQSQLKAAYMNQERAAQQTEKNYLKHLEKERVSRIDTQMEFDRQEALNELAGKDDARRVSNKKAQLVLDQQIEEKTRVAMEDGQRQFMEDKQMVDDIVNKVQREDDQASEALREKQSATRKFINDFQVQQQAYKADQKRKEEDEMERIRGYNQAQLEREKGVAEKKAAKKAEEDRIFKIMEDKARVERMEKEEYDSMREMLWQEELEQQRQAAEMARSKHQQDIKDDMIQANEYQKVIRAARREDERKEELASRQRMVEQFEEDERKARMASEERLRVKEAYIQDINSQRRHRREIYDSEVEAQKAELKKMKDEEEFRQMVVEEARQRLLREHAGKLQGFLPRGVLQKQEDLQLLRPQG